MRMKIITGFAVVVGLFVCCQKEKPGTKETVLKGKTTVWCDETIFPLLEDQVQVFESQYDAEIDLVGRSEAETLNALFRDTIKIAVLSRDLYPDERKAFENKKIYPKVTPFAVDAVVLIRNKSERDSTIALDDVIAVLRGNKVSKVKGLVFDNLNSSTARTLRDLAKIKELPAGDVYSFAKNDEVIKYVAENPGMVGVVGLNAITQPYPEMEHYLENVNVLAVKGIGGAHYYKPSQNNLAEETYPLARHLFVVNCQGYQGLGIGLASFAAGEIGQRIVLKSGLLPVRLPSRKIVTRNKIDK
jgi:phosphate transport system substrate-binding protein